MMVAGLSDGSRERIRDRGLQPRRVAPPGALLSERYQLDHVPSQQEVLAIAEKWRPYRSLATSYLFSAAFERASETSA